MAAPAPLAHLAQAELSAATRAYNAYQRLLADPDTLDWAVISLYYSAMHLVRAHAQQILSTNRTVRIPHTHEDGKSHVMLKVDPKLFTPYKRLLDGSVSCRYSRYLPDSAEVERYHDDCYVPVKDALAALGVK